MKAPSKRTSPASSKLGDALVNIRNERLYRSYGTFEAYCKERWGFERRHAYRLIEAVGVNENVSHGTQIKPSSERQLRPLSRLEPEQQKKVWKKAVQTSPKGKVTAKHVQEVVEELSPAPDQRMAPVSPEYPHPITEDFKKAFECFLDEFKKAKTLKWETTSKLAAVLCLRHLYKTLYNRE